MHPDINKFTETVERKFAPTIVTPEMLEAKYGPPFFCHDKKGTMVYDGPNEAYFAGLHAARNIELWEPLERSFYRYCDKTGLFAEITQDLIKQEASELLLAMGRDRMVIGLIRDRTDRRLAAMVNQLKGIVEQRDAFKKSMPFIHLANGILMLKRGGGVELLPFSPEYRSRNQSPIVHDPTATCPRFLDELILPAVHPEDVAIIQKYMGLCMLGRNLIQRFLILDGTPGRGKSQLAIVNQHLVGMPNCAQLRTQHLGERFELYRFLRKTLLTGVDVPADFLSTKGASVIKALVGGDYMDAEMKGGNDNFPIEGAFCVLITSNSRLRVRLEGDVGAWRRRLLLVRYESPPVAKKIPDFGAYLVKTEGSGILNWTLDGLAALLQDIDATGDIALTPRQSGTVDALLAESDSLRQFLAERVVKDAPSDLTVDEVVKGYAEFCPTRGWNPLPITIIHRQAEALMLELFQTIKSNSIERDDKAQRGFRHVRFK
jgi:phage/plasmid-associated DNA primase